MEGTKKMKTTPKMEMTSKMKLKDYLKFNLMTSYRDSHTTTDVKPKIIPGIQTGNGIPHEIYNIRGIAHARTSRKDNIFMQRGLGPIFTCIVEWGQGTCKKKHTRPELTQP